MPLLPFWICLSPAVSPVNFQALELAELNSTDAGFQDQLGVAVSLSGDRALVGADLDNHSGRVDAGSAYVFERDAGGSWSQVAKLTALDRAASDFFGGSVALEGERALVGADGDDDRGSFAGSVYVFERGTAGAWPQVAKLLASDANAFDIFGESLSLSGDRLLIGAPGHSELAPDCGAAYVFERDANGAWREVAELAPADARPGSFFGAAVVLSGNRALIGAFSDDERGLDAGAAYVFERTESHPGPDVVGVTSGGRRRSGAWRQIAKLTPEAAAPGDAFGASVALSGKLALIGAYGDDSSAPDGGAAYVFERVNGGPWTESAKLLVGGAASDFAGTSVAWCGARALIAVSGADDQGADAGAVSVFERAGTVWIETERLTASDGSAQDGFGTALAAGADEALVGAPRGEGPSADTGSAYVFDLDP